MSGRAKNAAFANTPFVLVNVRDLEVIENVPFLPMYLESDGGAKICSAWCKFLQLIQRFLTAAVTVNIVMSRKPDKKIWLTGDTFNLTVT